MSGELLIVQPGHKLPSLNNVPGDFSDWILAGMGLPSGAATVLYPQDGDPLPASADPAAVVLTGSGAMVTDRAPWMLDTEAWLREQVAGGTPVLGICFGHQLLAQALGGEVADNPRGIEVGSVQTVLTDGAGADPLLGGMPSRFAVQASHRQSVIVPPPGTTVLAASEQDPHHALRFASRAWGVQFHPEFDARIVCAYETFYRPLLAADYRQALQTRRRETPQAHGILRRFRELFVLPVPAD